MDSFRSISVASLAQLAMIGAMTPTLVEANEEDDHRRSHSRGHVQTVSHVREDYPVIWRWLESPGQSESAKS